MRLGARSRRPGRRTVVFGILFAAGMPLSGVLRKSSLAVSTGAFRVALAAAVGTPCWRSP